MRRQSHWNTVYSTKGEQVSWFEALPALSLRMMDAAGLTSETCVLDVGGGDSRLVDHLAAPAPKIRAIAVVMIEASRRHHHRHRRDHHRRRATEAAGPRLQF